MVRTRVGYAGGTSYNPTYSRIGDHSETVQIDFDPSVVSYDRLLDVFWRSHEPTLRAYSTQYRSVAFYHSASQKKAITESMQREEARLGQKIQTAVLPFVRFYLAEDYHQKYYLRSEGRLFAELSVIYPDFRDFVNSTAAARLNGYASGYGDEETVRKHLDELGLSDGGKDRLLAVVGRGLSPACPAPVGSGEKP